jgi:MarR family transcriptional regulator, lower aerobic nicotinate degradation pathway regulator
MPTSLGQDRGRRQPAPVDAAAAPPDHSPAYDFAGTPAVALPQREDTPLDGYVVEDQVGFLLRRVHQRHTAIFQAGMRAADLTPTQFTALVKVVELGRVTQNHLGRLAAMDPATIQGVVRRLVARGLVQTRADPADKRSIVLAPTEAGVALLGLAVPAAQAITATTLAPLSPAEAASFVALLRRMG